MDVEVDHYGVLGLASDEEGARLSEQEINKAYRSKVIKLHPDKRHNDPNAHANFLKLQNSYEILKDKNARKLFDDLLRIKREKLRPQHSKRRKMMSDLEERERSAFVVDPREEEERISQQLKHEIARIKAMYSNKHPAPTEQARRKADHLRRDSQSTVFSDDYENKVLEKMKKATRVQN